MKRLFVVLFLMNLALFANAQVSASSKVKEANSSSALKSYSEDQILELNFRAEHLVSVELSKSPITSDFNLALIENGKVVTLTDSDMQDFNPLLYAIPQEEVICNNFHIKSREGNSYTLVVLSKQQYNQQLKQHLRDINKKK